MAAPTHTTQGRRLNPAPQLSRNLFPDEGAGLTMIHEVNCDLCTICPRELWIMPADLEDFVVGVLTRYGVPADEAQVTAEILVASDTRGIFSHGVARLGRYVNGIRDGYIVPGAAMVVEEPAPVIGTIDAKNGIGQVAGKRGNDLAIDKAKQYGIGVVTVKHSNHYGIAGYYALEAAKEGLIGISMTNSAPLVVPTFGAEALIGTNPIAFAAPSGKYPYYLLDMATSVVPRGKLEVYDRQRKQMPAGWTVDEHGYDALNPGQVLKNLIDRVGGGIMPLGGRGTGFSGHKGYGLSVMVDILAGILSGAGYGPGVNNLRREVPEGEIAAPDVGHLFMAIDVAKFMPKDEFLERIDDYLTILKTSRKALDQDTIYFHGEQSQAKAAMHEKVGIPMAENVHRSLISIAESVNAPLPKTTKRHAARSHA